MSGAGRLAASGSVATAVLHGLLVNAADEMTPDYRRTRRWVDPPGLAELAHLEVDMPAWGDVPCGHAEPELFSGQARTSWKEAVAIANICGDCPMRQACYDYAEQHGETGWWGGHLWRPAGAGGSRGSRLCETTEDMLAEAADRAQYRKERAARNAERAERQQQVEERIAAAMPEAERVDTQRAFGALLLDSATEAYRAGDFAEWARIVASVAATTDVPSPIVSRDQQRAAWRQQEMDEWAKVTDA